MDGSKEDNVPKVIEDDVRRQYYVVKYSFVYDSSDSFKIKDYNMYTPPNIQAIKNRLSLQPSLNQIHFRKSVHMTTVLKGP